MTCRSLRLALAAGCAAAALLLGTLPATAQPAPADAAGQASDTAERPVILADELVHDRALDTLTARGNVEIRHAGSILLADTVNYQATSGRATATGSVVLVSPEGATMFAEHAELSGDLGEGFVREARLLLQDGSRAAARTAVRTTTADGATRTTMQHGIYSACDACPDDPSRPLIWQVKAMQVVHDQESRNITYRNAWLELWGVPVAYTPWLSHPDPTVRRQSGFLAPSYGSSRALGVTVTVPYYFAFAPNHDATLAPMFTSDQGVVAAGEHRYIGQRGSIVSSGSFTRDSAGRIRNHLEVDGEYLFSDIWRGGAEINLASDDTYRRRYRWGGESYLTSRGYVEGFSRRSHASVDAYRFQDLTGPATIVGTPQAGEPPLVAPLAQWSMVGAPGRAGQFQTATINTVALTRSQGASSRRLSGEWGWHLPHIARTGEVWRLDLSLRGDAYDVHAVPQPDGSRYSGQVGRLVPQAAVTWSWPMERPHATYHEVLEPIIMGVISPRGQNSSKIPNEDSLDFEFDDTNLFSANRFTGWDRVESGPRVNYGVRWAAVGRTIGTIEALVGQSYLLNRDGIFANGSGLRDGFSDYVGRVSVRPGPNLDLLYRFRVDKDTLTPQRTEVGAVIGPPILRLTSTYINIPGQPLTDGGPATREELSLGLSSQVSRYWQAGVSSVHDLTSNGGTRSIGASVAYEDECFIFALDGRRDYTYDRDYQGGVSLMLRFTLKTLGEVGTAL